jgi:twitching motility protein PilI
MANRDALRAFQSRLASRLQAARTTGVAATWLAVEAGEGRYLFPLGHAGEIFPWTPPQPVPYTESWFLGVANLRGGLYGVVQLSAFASGGPAMPATTEAQRPSRPPNPQAQKHLPGTGICTPTQQGSAGRKSTCKRFRSNPSF